MMDSRHLLTSSRTLTFSHVSGPGVDFLFGVGWSLAFIFTLQLFKEIAWFIWARWCTPCTQRLTQVFHASVGDVLRSCFGQPRVRGELGSWVLCLLRTMPWVLFPALWKKQNTKAKRNHFLLWVIRTIPVALDADLVWELKDHLCISTFF